MALAVRSLVICFLYGVMAIFQTLNSRYLYRNLNFHFYSFVLLLNDIGFWNSKDSHYCNIFLERSKTAEQIDAYEDTTLLIFYVP